MLLAAEFENATSRNRAEPVAIWKARKFIEEHSGEELSLTKVAKAVNMNAELSERKIQAGNWHEFCRVRRMHSIRKQRVIFCATAVCASVTSRSPRDFNRCRSSIACSKDFRVNRQHNTVLPSVCVGGIGKIPIGE